MSFIQQFFTSRDNNANAETFVGQQGRLWWNPETNQIYSSDGNTPGGIPLAGGGGGNGTPGGSNSQVQFNQNGTFGGTANLTIDRTTGALTAVSFVGNGAALTSVTGANITGTVANATYAVNAGSATTATSATTAGTVTTAAQPNITSVGTLTGVTSTGNISTTGNVVGNYILGNGSQLTGLSATYGNANVAAYLPTYTGNLAALTGNVTTTANLRGGNLSVVGSINLGGLITATGNITGGNLLTGANVSAVGNVIGGNIITGGLVTTVGNVVANYFVGNGAALIAINGANVVGEVSNATYASSAINAITAETVTAAEQPNITSVGILSVLSVNGNITGNYFIGNGSQLTGISSSSSNRIFNGTSNVEIATANGNVNITTAASNTWNFNTTGALVFPSQGNINAGVFGDEDQFVSMQINSPVDGSVAMIGHATGGFETGSFSVDGTSGGVPTISASDLDAEFDANWYFNGNGAIGFPNNKLTGDVGSSQFTVTSTANVELGAIAQPAADSVQTGHFAAVFAGSGADSQTDGVASGRGGSVYVEGGTGGNTNDYANAGPGGDVAITGGGTWSYSLPGGNVELQGGQGIFSDIRGNVKMVSYNAGNAEFSSQTGVFSVAGNVMTGNFFIGNGSALSSITGSNVSGTVANATYALSANSASSLVNGSAAVLLNSDGTMVFPSNNINAGANPITLWSTDSSGLLWRDAGGGAPSEPVQTTIDAGNGAATITVSTGVLAVQSQKIWTFNTAGNTVFPDSTVQTTAYPGNATTLSLSGNITGGNILATGGGTISTDGNVNGNVFNGNVAFGAGVIGGSGNITGGNLNATGLSLSGNVVSAINTVANITTTANITGGNVLGTTSVAVDGTGGNLTMTGGAITGAGSITSTGNITGGNIIGTHVGNLTGTTASLSGNVTGGNLLTGGLISATGNITGGNILGGANVNATTHTGTTVSVTGNINSGNLTTAGAVYSNYNTNTANVGSFMATGGNTKGGTGYLDFLVAQNTSGGSTNPYKWLRVNPTGGLEIINSAYTATLLTLTDAGAFSVASTVSSTGFNVNNKQAVNGPAFRAYVDSGQAITSGSQQKVTFGTETFDTNSNFASSRFTPTVEGYYQLNATVRISGTSGTGEIMITIWKNGSEYARGTNESGTEQGSGWYSMQVSDLAYANGTGDYFEIYIQQSSGGNRDTTAGTNISYFSGAMVRGA